MGQCSTESLFSHATASLVENIDELSDSIHLFFFVYVALGLICCTLLDLSHHE